MWKQTGHVEKPCILVTAELTALQDYLRSRFFEGSDAASTEVVMVRCFSPDEDDEDGLLATSSPEAVVL